LYVPRPDARTREAETDAPAKRSGISRGRRRPTSPANDELAERFNPPIRIRPAGVRTSDSNSQAADEAATSRIYAGQHFRYDEDAGQTLGDEVGEFVSDNLLGSVPHGR